MKLSLIATMILSFFQFASAGLVKPDFYSHLGKEVIATFSARHLSALSQIELQSYQESSRKHYENNYILPTFDYLYGPLVNKSLGSPLHVTELVVNWDHPIVENGKVYLEYTYKGKWTVANAAMLGNGLHLPIPYSKSVLVSPQWKSCTDRDPEHQTLSFYWYFWDPSRSGCDHTIGEHYQNVKITILSQTPQTQNSYPEYHQLLKSAGIDNNFQMTFAFGYADDSNQKDLNQDWDIGASEYRKFLTHVKNQFPQFQSTPILRGEYLGFEGDQKVIGHSLKGKRDGVDVTINVVINFGIDQMKLFAQSFAHNHDGFFAWFGHSRVGSGFDAQQFANMVSWNPDYYSISNQYQLIYWGGCNSYSYYTKPFFELKARAANGSDPKGTKSLDIVANGLPSYFHFNAKNAEISLDMLMKWQTQPTYQEWIRKIENYATDYGALVLAMVVGDEDNSH